MLTKCLVEQEACLKMTPAAQAKFEPNVLNSTVFLMSTGMQLCAFAVRGPSPIGPLSCLS